MQVTVEISLSTHVSGKYYVLFKQKCKQKKIYVYNCCQPFVSRVWRR